MSICTQAEAQKKEQKAQEEEIHKKEKTEKQAEPRQVFLLL